MTKIKYINVETGNFKRFSVTLNQRDDMFGDDDKWPVYYYSITNDDSGEILIKHSKYFNFENDAKNDMMMFFKSKFEKYGHIVFKEPLPNFFNK